MAYTGKVYTLIGEDQSAGPVNSTTLLAIASVAAVTLGSFLVTRDYIVPHTSLHVQPTTVSVSQGAATAVAIGMATVANPAMADESLLDSLGAQYTPGYAQQASKSGVTEAPKGKGRAALGELTKEVKAAPSIFDTPAQKEKMEAAKKPSSKKPASYVSQPLPERKAAKKPAGPGYGTGKSLPSIAEEVPNAKVSASKAPAPVAAAPAKAESKGIGFFGKKPPQREDAPAPAAAPAKGTAKYPTVAKKASKTKEAAPVTAPATKASATKPGTPVKPVKVEKKGSVKKEDPKKAKKDAKNKKKSGGNPLLGPLALIGGVYGLGVYAGKEDEEAASEEPPAPVDKKLDDEVKKTDDLRWSGEDNA